MDNLKELRIWFVACLALNKGELADVNDVMPKLKDYLKKLDASVEIIELLWKTLGNHIYLFFKTNKPMPTEEIYFKSNSITFKLKGLKAAHTFPSIADFVTEEKVGEYVRRCIINYESSYVL